MPAQAGIQGREGAWIPACAGMTEQSVVIDAQIIAARVSSKEVLARQAATETRNISRKVIHVPIGTTQQMKMSCATFKATTENPPWPPSPKGGGPKDRGIFASSRHFHKRRKGCKGRKITVKINSSKKFISSLRTWRALRLCESQSHVPVFPAPENLRRLRQLFR